MTSYFDIIHFSFSCCFQICFDIGYKLLPYLQIVAEIRTNFNFNSRSPWNVRGDRRLHVCSAASPRCSSTGVFCICLCSDFKGWQSCYLGKKMVETVSRQHPKFRNLKNNGKEMDVKLGRFKGFCLVFGNVGFTC